MPAPPDKTVHDKAAHDKAALRDELATLLAADLSTRERAHRAAKEAATHEEAKPENDKDTRALEQSYLARGEAQRVEQLRAALAAVQGMPLRAFRDGEPAALGALVTAEEGEQTLLIFLAPDGGGSRLADGRVQVVTPRSPLGQAVLGKRTGDDALLESAGKKRELSVVRVA